MARPSMRKRANVSDFLAKAVIFVKPFLGLFRAAPSAA
jgi:hypothetical protein